MFLRKIKKNRFFLLLLFDTIWFGVCLPSFRFICFTQSLIIRPLHVLLPINGTANISNTLHNTYITNHRISCTVRVNSCYFLSFLFIVLVSIYECKMEFNEVHNLISAFVKYLMDDWCWIKQTQIISILFLIIIHNWCGIDRYIYNWNSYKYSDYLILLSSTKTIIVQCLKKYYCYLMLLKKWTHLRNH